MNKSTYKTTKWKFTLRRVNGVLSTDLKYFSCIESSDASLRGDMKLPLLLSPENYDNDLHKIYMSYTSFPITKITRSRPFVSLRF